MGAIVIPKHKQSTLARLAKLHRLKTGTHRTKTLLTGKVEPVTESDYLKLLIKYINQDEFLTSVLKHTEVQAELIADLSKTRGDGKRKYRRWQDIKTKAETFVDKYGFIDKKALRRLSYCSKNTLNKAIEHSDKLKEAIKHPKSPKFTSLTDEMLAILPDDSKPSISDTKRDETLDNLLEAVRKGNPEQLEWTKAQINAMDSEGKRRFAQAYSNMRPTPISKGLPKRQRKHRIREEHV